MIRPHRRSFIPGIIALAIRKGACTLTAIASFQRSVLMSRRLPRARQPALLTTTSMLPNSSSPVLTSDSICPSSVTSQSCVTALTPYSEHIRAVSSRRSLLWRVHNSRFAPSCANITALVRPWFRVAPVIKTVFPASPVSISGSCSPGIRTRGDPLVNAPKVCLQPPSLASSPHAISLLWVALRRRPCRPCSTSFILVPNLTNGERR